MKKTIGIVLASLSLLLAGSSIGTSVASASTATPSRIDIYPLDLQGSPAHVNAHPAAYSVKIKTITDVKAMPSFDGKSGDPTNTYGKGTTLMATLYYNSVFNTFAYLVQDSSTSEECWVNPESVETVHI